MDADNLARARHPLDLSRLARRLNAAARLPISELTVEKDSDPALCGLAGLESQLSNNYIYFLFR
jgi:hypothetical protein